MPGAVVDPRVTAALQQAPTTTVIISLASAPVPSTLLRSDLAALEANVALRTAGVSARHPSLQVTRAYTVVPALAATIDAPTLPLLAVDPDIVAISPDELLHLSLVQTGALIGSSRVHSELNVTGAGVTVAVIDSGIDTDHPQLSNDVVYQHCYLQSGLCPGGGTTGTSAEDDDGHGTHLSGIITSTFGGGPAPGGIAPDAKIEAFKVSSGANAIQTSDVIASYNEIIASHPEVKIINLSLGDNAAYPLNCDTNDVGMTNAVSIARSLGVTTFAASGNGGWKVGVDFPACISKVIAVGAVFDANVGRSTALNCTDATSAPDQVTCFSQSSTSLPLLAPGSVITSTWLNGAASSMAGTSSASAVAAGVAALVLQQDPLLTPDQLQARLTRTGVAIRDSGNSVISCRVDAYAAVTNNPVPNCPVDPDPDHDGIPYAADNCPNDFNPLQENKDGNVTDLSSYGKAFNDVTAPNSDVLGDACDTDVDNDGLTNAEEQSLAPGSARCPRASGPTDPKSWDTDGDGVYDGAECALGTDPRSSLSKPPRFPANDTDHDGLPDAFEIAIGTDPARPDTDGDKLIDGVEVMFYGTDPLNPNTDGDICSDGKEAASLNDDTKVNTTDMLIVSQSFSTLGSSTYVRDFDINRDGAINATDMLIQAKVFGAC